MWAMFVYSFGMDFNHSLILVYTQPKGVPAWSVWREDIDSADIQVHYSTANSCAFSILKVS